MHNLVLYCKSYYADVDRVVLLLQSILTYNKDNIPFYISVPAADISLFRDKLGTTGYELIPDEDIDTEGNGWKGQQIVKAQFWKLNLTKNYVCLDSDSYFIKPFYISDFLFDDTIPYTVCHEQKDLFEWAQKKLPFDPQHSFKLDRQKVMELFDRTGRYYDFGPSPVIWNSKVWASFEQNYIQPNNLSFADIINFSPSEFSWYGEYLIYSKLFPIYPAQPLFKVFHYENQYIDSKNKNYTLEDISRNYIGIILQSNWNSPLKY